MKLLNFFFHFFFSRKFYLVNSPIQYLCMMEYFHTKNLKISEFTIIVGYCSLSSKKQIKILNKEFDNFNQNIFFLDELLNINIFHQLFFVQKKIKRKFLLTVGAAYNNFEKAESILPIYCSPINFDKNSILKLSLGNNSILFAAITEGENEIFVSPKFSIFPSLLK